MYQLYWCACGYRAAGYPQQQPELRNKYYPPGKRSCGGEKCSFGDCETAGFSKTTCGCNRWLYARNWVWLNAIESDLTWAVGAIRHNLLEEGETLIKILNVPYFATPMSKGVSERIAGKFGGIYSGGASTAEVKHGVESADLVLFLGRYPVSDSFDICI